MGSEGTPSPLTGEPDGGRFGTSRQHGAGSPSPVLPPASWPDKGTYGSPCSATWSFYYLLWRRKWQPTPVVLPGKSHGQRNLVGYSPWGHKESDTTEWLHFLFCYKPTWRPWEQGRLLDLLEKKEGKRKGYKVGKIIYPQLLLFF